MTNNLEFDENNSTFEMEFKEVQVINNGEGGGVSPTAYVEQLEDGAKIVITDESGTTSATVKNGYTPIKGVDYYTEEDKTKLVEELSDTPSKALYDKGSWTGLPDCEMFVYPDISSGQLRLRVVVHDPYHGEIQDHDVILYDAEHYPNLDLTGAIDLDEFDKQAIRDNIGVTEIIGSIESALENIITIQNSLIGGESV